MLLIFDPLALKGLDALLFQPLDCIGDGDFLPLFLLFELLNRIAGFLLLTKTGFFNSCFFF